MEFILFIICLLLGHKFYYENSYTKIRAIFMTICTENGFCFSHCDWLDIIQLSYHLVIQFRDPHSLVSRQSIDSVVTSYTLWWGTDGILLTHLWGFEHYGAYLSVKTFCLSSI